MLLADARTELGLLSDLGLNEFSFELQTEFANSINISG